jgi:hypothetical protein
VQAICAKMKIESYFQLKKNASGNKSCIDIRKIKMAKVYYSYML